MISIEKINMIKVETVTVRDQGSCNFCKRGILTNSGTNMVYPYSTVHQISNNKGGGIKANLCDDCLNVLIMKAKL